MKITQIFQTWRASRVVALTVGAIVLCAQNSPAHILSGVSVHMGPAWWESGGCPPPQDQTSPDKDLLPVLHHKCDEIEVYAGGANYYPTGPNCSYEGVIYATFSAEDHGTGCKIDVVTNTDGYIEWHVSEPKHSGSIDFHADIANGQCPAANQPPCTVDGQEWHATGTLQVELPPCEDEGGGCGCSSTCSIQPPALGGGTANNDNGIDFRLQLGPGSTALDAGFLWLNAESTSPNLTSPNTLRVPEGHPNVQAISVNNSLYQVKAPQGLVILSQIDAYAYHMDCYYDSDVQWDGNANVYQLIGSPSPYVSWSVENPNGASSNNRLKIVETRGSSRREFNYTNDPATLRWDLGLPDGRTTHSTWRAAAPSDSALTNFFREVTSDGKRAKKTQKTYKFIQDLNYLLLIQEIDGDGAVTNITNYSYYSADPLLGPITNKLKSVENPSGSWIYYKYDTYGRKSVEFSSYGNCGALPTGREPTLAQDHCKEIDYSYTLNNTDDGATDNGTISPWSPRKTVASVFVDGDVREISRSYHQFTDTVTEESVECPNPGAKWNAGGNLHTLIYKFYIQDGAADFRREKPERVFRPDGTMTRYDYAGDGATEVEETGQSSVWGDRSAWVVDGTQTTTLRDERGRVTSRTTRAIRNSVADIILSSEIYSYSDPLGRSYDVTDLAQRTTHYGYSCCGLDYVTDADGATTYYLYDESLKRLIGTRRVVDVVFLAERSIITTNLLDPMGRVLATKRVGTNGTVITTVQLSYDILGRLVRQTNALGGITSYTNYTDYDTGLSYKTNTYPNGGTRIETFNRDGTLASVAGSAALGVRYDYAAEKEPESSGPYRAYTKETKVKLDRSISSEWTKTYSDGLGRAYKMLYAPRPEDTEAPSALSVYNARGQLWKEQDPDAVVTLHIFNAKAEAEYTILAMSPTISSKTYDELYAAFIDPGGIDASGLADRITRVQRSVEDEVPGVTPPLTRVDTSVWDEGLSTTTLISRSETSADGLHSWQTTYGDDGLSVVSEITNVWAANGNRYTTNVAPDGAYVVNAFHLGRLVIVARFDSARNQISSTAYSYDAHGRANGTIDVRNGSTIYTFNDADFVSTVTTPVPGTPGDRPQVTTTDYDLMLQPTMVHNPDGTTVTTEYYLTGQIMRNYGSRTYPVGYGYDYAGRMNLMTNWTSFLTGAGTRVTSWHYDGSRGWLDTKGYADNTSTAYTYTKGGRLKARSWARLGTDNNPLVTTYTYGFNDGTSGNDHDGLVGISYPNDPQGTLAVAYDYDRRGRQKTITQAGNTTHLAYNNAGQQIRESYDNGTLNAYAVTNGFDQFLRRTNLVLLQGSTRLHRNVFGYDAASRLQKVADDTTATPYSASYSYLANSPLISQIIFNRDTTEVMCTTKQFDYLNRLTLISSGLPAIGPAAFSYSYNDANQRTRRVENDSSMWRYEYDTLGQVKSAKRYWSDQLPVAAQQFEYTFDDIGNRTLTKAGGDKFGGNLRQAAYTVNNVNQYTDRGIPGALDIMGVALAGETVTVQAQDAQNNADPVYRHGEYFRKELHFNNNSGPLWEQVTIGATGEPDVTGYEFLPKNQEQFTYDEDGNLTSDGHWNYGWDAENRLIALTNNASGAPDMVIHFEYDSRSRRIQKQVWNNGDGHGTPALVHKFLYDGWNLIAELDTLASTISTYSWGLDLSGTMQGAGGVGGLLWLRQASGVPHFAAHDGNGNVAMLLSSSDGSVSARYEYGPFGELLRATGPMPKANPFRFSTKYEDEETDLLYYGYRYCSPSVGRWLLRDPIQENGAMNPYSFANNDALRGLDGLGNITVIYPRSVSGDARDITVEINATLTVSDVCHGGPLLFTVNFDVDYDNQGGGVGPGTWFSYGGTRTQATGYHESDKHMLWSVVYSKPLPVCPSGRQSGSLQFDTGEWQETMVSIILDWHYKCDCACRESEPFKPSYTYLVFPPIELPKPRPPRPGKPIRFDRKTI